MNFLTNRKQYVKVGDHILDFLFLKTGASQGHVHYLPMLYSLYCSKRLKSELLKRFQFPDDSDGDVK